DAPPFARANWNVLQVGFGRGQATGRRRGQRVTCVYALGLWMDVAWQGVGVGGLELGKLAPVADLARQFVDLSCQLFKNLRGGRPLAGLGLGTARQTHAAKQNVAKLLRRADGEAFSRQLVDLVFQRSCAL